MLPLLILNQDIHQLLCLCMLSAMSGILCVYVDAHIKAIASGFVFGIVIFFLFEWCPMFYLGSSTNSLRLLAFHNASHSDLSSVPPCPGTWPGVFCFHLEDASSRPFSSQPVPAGFPRFGVSLLTVVQWIQFI